MRISSKLGLLTYFLLVSACDKDASDSKQSAQIERSVTSSTDVLSRKSWHKVEGLRVEPFSFPSVSMDKITGLKKGDPWENIERFCGFRPVQYYEGVNFKIIYAKSNAEEVYEVAFLFKDEKRIEDISYRKIANTKDDSTIEIDPFKE
jgi:hypothetical protein